MSGDFNSPSPEGASTRNHLGGAQWDNFNATGDTSSDSMQGKERKRGTFTGWHSSQPTNFIMQVDIHPKKIIHLTYASPKYLPRISAIGQFGRYILLTGSIFTWTRNVYSFATSLLQESGASCRIEYSSLDLVSRLVLCEVSSNFRSEEQESLMSTGLAMRGRAHQVALHNITPYRTTSLRSKYCKLLNLCLSRMILKNKTSLRYTSRDFYHLFCPFLSLS